MHFIRLVIYSAEFGVQMQHRVCLCNILTTYNVNYMKQNMYIWPGIWVCSQICFLFVSFENTISLIKAPQSLPTISLHTLIQFWIVHKSMKPLFQKAIDHISCYNMHWSIRNLLRFRTKLKVLYWFRGHGAVVALIRNSSFHTSYNLTRNYHFGLWIMKINKDIMQKQ